MRIIPVIVLLAIAAPANAATNWLVASWFEGANQYCKYNNGTILNVGSKRCPRSFGEE